MISPIGLAWSKTKPNSLRQRRAVDLLRPPQRQLFGGGEQQLDAHRASPARPAAGPLPAARPPRPCCRPRGSPRCGCETRRRRAATFTGAASGTVSRWAHRSTVRAPSGAGIRAMRLPHSEPTAVRARVLLDLQAGGAQLRRHRVGHRPLLQRRALDLAQAHEVERQPLALLGRGPRRSRVASTPGLRRPRGPPRRPRARPRARDRARARARPRRTRGTAAADAAGVT